MEWHPAEWPGHVSLAGQQGSFMQGKSETANTRSCTCHPDEAPVPCQRKYALSECQAAAQQTTVPHALSDIELRYHAALPNWVRMVGLKVRAIPECEGGGFAIDRQQAEIIMDLRSHVLRLEGMIMEKNRTIAAARKALGGSSNE